MAYTVYHLLGHIHAQCTTSNEVLNEVLTLIPIGNVKQRKLVGTVERLRPGGYAEVEYNGACVLITRDK